jgi:hypothetical protein
MALNSYLFVGRQVTFEPFHQVYNLFRCRQLPILRVWIVLYIQKVCGKQSESPILIRNNYASNSSKPSRIDI